MTDETGKTDKTSMTDETSTNDKATMTDETIMIGHALLLQVAKNGMRPLLPAQWPRQLAVLVSECWSHWPQHRPSALELRSRLKEMYDSHVMDVLPH